MRLPEARKPSSDPRAGAQRSWKALTVSEPEERNFKAAAPFPTKPCPEEHTHAANTWEERSPTRVYTSNGKGFRAPASHPVWHLATHSGLQRPLGGKRLGQQVQEEDRPYNCNYCGKSFARSAHLARHQETHSGERPYKCTYCGKAFGRNSHLTRHHSTHTGERPYECGVCGKAFTRSAHVTRHQGTHTGERPFRCARCGKRFTRSAHLQRHQGIHSGDKPFSCGDCGKGFTRNAHLERHRATHSGEKPFKCASLAGEGVCRGLPPT
uniref:Uncharacterized protein n=1 Tax=Sphaerodactylus townsendi TaxID=933632 RepID=A0ACB8EV08_9SAUR